MLLHHKQCEGKFSHDVTVMSCSPTLPTLTLQGQQWKQALIQSGSVKYKPQLVPTEAGGSNSSRRQNWTRLLLASTNIKKKSKCHYIFIKNTSLLLSLKYFLFNILLHKIRPTNTHIHTRICVCISLVLLYYFKWPFKNIRSIWTTHKCS